MRFCMQCGNQLQDDDRVCTNCGTLVQAVESSSTSSNPSTAESNQQPLSPQKPKSRKKLIAIIASIIVVCLLIIGGVGYAIYRHHTADASASASSQQTKSHKQDKKSTQSEVNKKKLSEFAKLPEDVDCSALLKQQDISENTKKSSTASKSSKSENTTPTVGNAILESTDWNWNGSAYTNYTTCSRNSTENSKSTATTYALSAWTSKNQDFTTCIVTPQIDSTEKEDSENPARFFATYGSNPKFYMLYHTIVKASGTTPQSKAIHVQPIDIDSCDSAKRIDLPTDIFVENWQNKVTFAGRSEQNIAFALSSKSSELGDYRYSYEIVAINNKTNKITTLEKQENQQVNSSADHYVDIVDYGLANTLIVNTSQGFQLFTLDDNTSIGTIPTNFCEDTYNPQCSISQAYDIGNNQILLMSTMGTPFVFNTADGSLANAHDSLQMPEEIYNLMQMHDGSFISVTSGRHVWYTDIASHSTHEIMSPEQWQKLTGKFDQPDFDVNPAKKTLYVQTTDEHIIIDTTGKQVGTYNQYSPTTNISDSEFDASSPATDSTQLINTTKLDGVAWIYADDVSNYSKENGVGINSYDVGTELASSNTSKSQKSTE